MIDSDTGVHVVDGLPEVWEDGLELPAKGRKRTRAVPLPVATPQPVHVASKDLPVTLPPIEGDTAEAIRAVLSDIARDCWIPRTSTATSPGRSHFGGLASGAHAHPRCGVCGAPMRLFLQLGAEDLPVPDLFEGLLQVFICTESADRDGACGAAAAWSQASRLRVVAAKDAKPQPPPTGAEVFDAIAISGWDVRADLPAIADIEARGRTLDDGQFDIWLEEPLTVEGDKLLGWPAWQQNADYVRCRECGCPMRVIFQIASEDHLPWMFDDGGCCYVSQCPQHREVLTLEWQSG